MAERLIEEVEKFKELMAKVVGVDKEVFDREGTEGYFNTLSAVLQRYRNYKIIFDKKTITEAEKTLAEVLTFLAKHNIFEEAFLKEHERQYLTITSSKDIKEEAIIEELTKEWEAIGGKKEELAALKTTIIVVGAILLHSFLRTGRIHTVINLVPKKYRPKAEGIIYGWLAALSTHEAGMLDDLGNFVEKISKSFSGGDYIA